VTAEKVVVRGTVNGQINGIRVTLAASARVTGELVCKALSVDEEAYFDGTSQRVSDPLSISVDKSKSHSADLSKAESVSSSSSSSKSDGLKSLKPAAKISKRIMTESNNGAGGRASSLT